MSNPNKDPGEKLTDHLTAQILECCKEQGSFCDDEVEVKLAGVEICNQTRRFRPISASRDSHEPSMLEVYATLNVRIKAIAVLRPKPQPRVEKLPEGFQILCDFCASGHSYAQVGKGCCAGGPCECRLCIEQVRARTTIILHFRMKALDYHNELCGSNETYESLRAIPTDQLRRQVFFDKHRQMWAVLYGPNMEYGVMGIGNTKTEAYQDFDQKWAELWADAALKRPER